MTLLLFTAHHTLGHTWQSVYCQWPCLQRDMTMAGPKVSKQWELSILGVGGEPKKQPLGTQRRKKCYRQIRLKVCEQSMRCSEAKLVWLTDLFAAPQLSSSPDSLLLASAQDVPLEGTASHQCHTPAHFVNSSLLKMVLGVVRFKAPISFIFPPYGPRLPPAVPHHSSQLPTAHCSTPLI